MGTPAPDSVKRLVDRFDQNRKVFLSGDYKEEQLRAEFLNPLFTALGWDMDNKQGLSETFKQVIHEESIKVAGASKAPDYTFRIGGRRTFFVEAKKPAVNVALDSAPAFQLRRYAWTARLPVSILSDFEEFAVYDCRLRPFKTDKPATARTMLLGYQDYATRWEELSGLFSPDAIQRGALERYVESTKTKKGTTAVDDAFLQEISRWREMLAKNIALRNPRLSTRELNFAVQRTIDRLIFLRICEDRGIESYAYLQSLLNGERVYARLLKHFRDADDKYNSGLFHFSDEKGFAEPPDKLSLDLDIDDKPLKDIIGNLYYPDSPYEFSVMPADVLGQVYEQFLGKVIRLTAGHQAKVEEKPEVRKAGGVYYTPTYIVDYIVKNTVGKLLEGKTPKETSDLRILDPACGSGSFLLGAYQHLLDWHLDYYQKQPQASSRKPQAPVHQDAKGNWRLTTAERKRILLNNIYGVDIDSQAVEVTKLSLLLKVLEGENQETLGSQLKLYHERALPDLGSNIKCGNSLIGPDFYQGEQQALFAEEEERLRINVFDWQAAFPDIMKRGGFDAVIGNPPYIRQLELGNEKDYYVAHYQTFNPSADIYVSFIEKGIQLLRGDGRFGMIVSNKWIRGAYGRALREFLAPRADTVVDFAGLRVFKGATVRTVVLTCRRASQAGRLVKYVPPPSPAEFVSIRSEMDIENMVGRRARRISSRELSPDGWSFADAGARELLRHMADGRTRLNDYVDGRMYRGVVTGLNEVFIISRETRDQLVKRTPRASEIVVPVLAGKNIRRYDIEAADRYLIFARRGIDIDRYPSVRAYLEEFKPELTPKRDKSQPAGRKPGSYRWFEIQDTIDYFEEFGKPKIIYPDIATDCRFALDTKGRFGANTTYFMPVQDLYLLGLLNSNLAAFYFKSVCAGLEGSGEIYLRFFGQYLEGFPVHAPAADNEADKTKRDKIVGLVETMLKLHKDLPKAKTPHEQESLQRQIAATDKQIDSLVYELYGLTENEIAVVEGRTR